MASFRCKRQAVTPKGVVKRLDSAGFERVDDPRRAASVKHPLGGVLQLAVAAIMGRRCSQRAMENASEETRGGALSVFGLSERVPDNVFGDLVKRIDSLDLRRCLHRLIYSEHLRGTFEATRTLPFGVVAIDGKALATLHEHDLRRFFPPEILASNDALRAALEAEFPWLQLNVSEHGRYATTLIHRATLVSSEAALAIDEVPVPANSNEAGQIRHTLDALHRTYGRTTLFEMVIADAGNCSLEAASWCDDKGYHYTFRVKGNQPDLLLEAERRLGSGKMEAEPPPDARTAPKPYRGASVRYEVWVSEASRGYLKWDHARQFIRVRRVVEHEHNGTRTEGNRYFITSMRAVRMKPETALAVARAYWRCENEQHWTADRFWSEDARKAPISRHPRGMLNASLLRLIAIGIAAILRSKCRVDAKGTRPPWRRVTDALYALFFQPLLPAEGVAAFEC